MAIQMPGGWRNAQKAAEVALMAEGCAVRALGEEACSAEALGQCEERGLSFRPWRQGLCCLQESGRLLEVFHLSLGNGCL